MADDAADILDDFLTDWDYLMFDNQDKMPWEFMPKYGFKNMDEMVDILNNALEGQKENGLNRINDVRNFMIDTRDFLREERPSWFIRYRERFYKDPRTFNAFENVINGLEHENFARMANIITPEEIMSLRSLARQKRLPHEMEREISSYVANKPRGGQNKSKRKRKTRKYKKKQKRKTKISRKNYRK
jgi:hypothetical protein